MKWLVKSIFVLIVISLSACTSKTEKTSKSYFDFDGLIAGQIRLVQNGDSLLKVSLMNDQEDKKTLPLDSTILTNELDIFRQLEVINRPMYIGQYEVVDEINDPRSNLKIKEYRAKVHSPVPVVRFYYLDDFAKLKKIEADFEENNTLYSTQRKLSLEFEITDGKLYLTDYTISGNQKMILSDLVKFQVTGSLIRH